MIYKFASMVLIVAVAAGSYIPHHDKQYHQHQSGQAVSSQKIVQDFTPSHEHHYNLDAHQHHDFSQHELNHQDLSHHDLSYQDLSHHDLSHHDLSHHDLSHHDISHHDLSHQEHQNSHPKYRFEYSVNDPKTEDQKSHWESRDGDVVEGEYSLKQPDGSTRTVTYKADKKNGFQAQVSTTGGENEAYHGHVGHQQTAQNIHGLDESSQYHHYY